MPCRCLTILTLGFVWHPVGLAQPDHVVPRGQHSSQPPAELAMLALGAPRGSPSGGRWDATPLSLPSPATAVLVSIGHPGGLPPGEGMAF